MMKDTINVVELHHSMLLDKVAVSGVHKNSPAIEKLNGQTLNSVMPGSFFPPVVRPKEQ